MTDPVCLACGQLLPSKRLLCANCREPIRKRDSWYHDVQSRAVHNNCAEPKGFAPLIPYQPKQST